MEKILLCTFGLTGIAFLVLANRNLLGHERPKFRPFNLLLPLSLLYCIASYFVLICTNIEMIHFLQYAIMSYWLMSIYPEPLACFTGVSFLGILDELFNYIWHPKFTPYLDFNDMILNSIGAIIGIAMYLAFHKHFVKNFDRKMLVGAFALAFTGCLVLLAGITRGFIIPYYPKSGDIESAFVNKAFVLSFKEHQEFWETTKGGRKFHIMDPVEGVLALNFFLSANGYVLQLCSKKSLIGT